MINFILWKWKQPGFRETYTADHVNVMREMLIRNCRSAHRVHVITDDDKGIFDGPFVHDIWSDLSHLKNISGAHLPSCYRRLKIFDPNEIDRIGIPRGERVVSMDLDAVITSPTFGELFDRDEEFVGWRVVGHRHPKVFNGSMFMHRAGEMSWLWHEFNPLISPKEAVKAGYMGSDQGYLTHRLINRSGTGCWTAQKDGVLSFIRDVRLPRTFSEKRSKVVFFAGSKKPWHPEVRRHSTWIERFVTYEGSVAAKGKETTHAAV